MTDSTMWDNAEDFGAIEPDGAFNAMAAGTGYALFRHGQDRQTRQLIEAINRSGGGPQEINVHIHMDEDERGAAPVNALDFSKAEMPDGWDDYVGQGPLKRQLQVHINSAQARGSPLPHTLLSSGFPGVGKGHDLRTKVLTPGGWRTVGSLAVGDDLIGSDGKATKITAIFDRGKLPLYEVRFSDGSKVRCDGDHLWQVQTPKQRAQGRWQVLPVQDILRQGATTTSGRAKWYIPMTAPVEHDKIELPVEPYLAGVMLGNADFEKGVIALNKKDFEIAERIMTTTRLSEYRPHTSLRFRPEGAQDILRSLGQLGASADEKYVPPIYLTAALEDRQALLAGLLDTDGSVRADRGSAQFHTTSPRLAADVQTLVESMGGTARIMTATRGEIRVDINVNQNPFSASRKASLWRPAKTRGPARSITEIVPVGETEVRCLQVDAADSLYVTERYIVTHNTTAARLIAKSMGVEIVELVPPFNVYTLAEAVSTLLDRDILFIDEIHKLADNGKRGAEILLKVLEDGVAYLPNGEVVQLNDITVVGATTDQDKLPEPVLDRFKIKPYFQPYSVPELAEITVNFAFRHDAEDVIDDDMAVTIAEACRGTPRITEEMVLAARDLAYSFGRPATEQELLEFMEVEPDGMTRQHIAYVTSLYQFFARKTKDETTEYVVGEAAMQQLLRETKPGIGRVERFLIERGYIDRTPRGRRLTARGIDRARQYIREGKGARSAG